MAKYTEGARAPRRAWTETETLRDAAGEHLRVTVDRRPVAGLVPLPSRATWVARPRVLDSLTQTDAGLHEELDRALPQTVEEL